MKYYRVLFVLSVLYFMGCADIKTNVIAPPPPSAKLRVLAIIISDFNYTKYGGISNEEFISRHYQKLNNVLQRAGIYDVIPENEVAAVLGDRNYVFSHWTFNNYSLVKKAGTALYADYAVIIERTSKSTSGNGRYHGMEIDFRLISFSSGKVYEASDFSGTGPIIVNTLYRKIFTAAKADMLATAIRKGRLAGPDKSLQKSGEYKQDTRAAEHPVTKEAKLTHQKDISSPAGEIKETKIQRPEEKKPASFDGKHAVALFNESKGKENNKLVVYDFDSTVQFNTVSLILAEALREELFKLGKFNLVNREDLTKAIDELQLQQSGLVDEKEKLRLGKWLAANQLVTGKFSEIGKLFILQARLTELETMKIKSMASAKCEQGHEECLLTSVEILARELAGIPAK